jgi:large subunit ribosomal protein L21
MYAVIETGGKQYRVIPGQTLEVELLPAEPGSEIALDRVLLVSTGTETLVGHPTIPGARVIGTVVREGRGQKILVFKFKSKKRYRRLRGHRQSFTYLAVTDIQANGESLVADEARKRYERRARWASDRFEATLLGERGDEIASAEPEPIVEEEAPASPRPASKRARKPAPEAEAPVSEEGEDQGIEEPEA